MRLDIHVHLHFCDVLQVRAEPDHRVLEAISELRDYIMLQSEKLSAEVASVQATASKEESELAVIATALTNQATITAAAVAAALAQAGVEEDEAADLIETARAATQTHVDAIFAQAQALNGAGGTGTGGGTTTPPPVTFAVSTAGLPDAVVGQAYSATIEFVGATGDVTVMSTPPSDNGLTVNTDGTVTGTAAAEADSSFAIAGTDSTGAVASATLTVHAAAAAAPVEGE